MSWLKLLSDAVEASSCQAVADHMGISRTVVSLVLRGKYPAKTDKIEQIVTNTYSRVDCPHLGISITKTQCAMYHNAPAPTSSPSAMRHWRACQSCLHNGGKENG